MVYIATKTKTKHLNKLFHIYYDSNNSYLYLVSFLQIFLVLFQIHIITAVTWGYLLRMEVETIPFS